MGPNSWTSLSKSNKGSSEITQQFTYVEHPQTNGQAKVSNRVFLWGLRRRLDEARGN